jgi:inositol-phosphate phosphatase/L-galactose 1-phosphate phosphatase/histidinol-phosphatase
MTDLADVVALAERMAEAVRPIVMGHFRKGVEVEQKADRSPVTVADRDAETVMRQLIQEAFPDHGICGEEHGSERLDARYVWVLDPIDGTKSYVTGKPLFGTLIAVLKDGRPVAGVIDMPALAERWVGALGRPTTFNGRPVHVRPCPGLSKAWLYATSPQMFEGPDATAFDRLRTRCCASVYGADCYAYGLLAGGTVDLICEASTRPYDYCALVPVVTGAGGIITDWEGRSLGLHSDGRVLAAGDPRVFISARQALAG